MRRFISHFSIAILCISVSLISCSKRSHSPYIARNYYEQSIAYDSTRFEFSNLDFKMTYPDGDDMVSKEIRQWLSEVICGMLRLDYQEDSPLYCQVVPADDFEEMCQRYKDVYLGICQDELGDELSDLSFMFQSEELFQDLDYVTYKCAVYSYTGGAHGNDFYYLQTIDKKTGKRVTFGDLVSPENRIHVMKDAVDRLAQEDTFSGMTMNEEDYVLAHFDENGFPLEKNGDFEGMHISQFNNPVVVDGGLLFYWTCFYPIEYVDAGPISFHEAE